MASRPKKSPSLKVLHPLPQSKPTDPERPRLPANPLDWPPSLRRLRARKVFLIPRPPLTEDQAAYVWNAADCVLNETLSAARIARFPKARWRDWLCRLAEAHTRTSRKLRPRLTGSHNREWLRVYMRHWLYVALRRENPALAELLPPEMHAGHSPLAHPIAPWKDWRRVPAGFPRN